MKILITVWMFAMILCFANHAGMKLAHAKAVRALETACSCKLPLGVR